MGLAQERERRRAEKPELNRVLVPVTNPTITLYDRAAQQIAQALRSNDVPAPMIMGAVLSAASEADLVLGFLHQNLEVISESADMRQLLREELEAVSGGTTELPILDELRRERRGPDGKTKLERFISLNPSLLQEVQQLRSEVKDQLIMQLILLRQDARNMLPQYLQSYAKERPEIAAKIRTALKRYREGRGNETKASVKLSP